MGDPLPEQMAAQPELDLAGVPQRLFVASASKMTTWLDCPRRYRMTYLDRPRPLPRPQRAHTTVGLVTHAVLRDFFALIPADRTPAAVIDLVSRHWADTGFRDPEQARRWRAIVTHRVTAYLKGIDRDTNPVGTERTVAFRTATLSFMGRVDRLDRRDGELVVVDYKTSRRPTADDDARTSLPLALYARAVTAMFRHPCTQVELHHVPTGSIRRYRHGEESLARKLREAESIVTDLVRAQAAYDDEGPAARVFAPRPSALCRWCDLRAHCQEGQAVGPEQPSWAGLDEDIPSDNADTLVGA